LNLLISLKEKLKIILIITKSKTPSIKIEIKVNGDDIPLTEEISKCIAALNKSIADANANAITFDDIMKKSEQYFVPNVVATKQRTKQLEALSKLMMCADYFNDAAEAYMDGNQSYYGYIYNNEDDKIHIGTGSNINYGNVPFENYNDAEETLRILGKSNIKLALTGHN